VGHTESPRALAPGQPDGSRRWHPCCCRCLLKDCERWFLPPWPQARYCSPTCQKTAEHWRSWRAGQSYRATLQGKERRREQARCRRERERQRAESAAAAPQLPPIEPDLAAIEAQTRSNSIPIISAVTQSVGQRPAKIVRNLWFLPCDRPGCYVLFPAAVAAHDQKFCSAPCRQALRRVRQREARLRHRRRRGARPLRRPRGGPPRAPAFMSSPP
jgi:hypothetical protein